MIVVGFNTWRASAASNSAESGRQVPLDLHSHSIRSSYGCV